MRLRNHFEFWCDEDALPVETHEDLGDGRMKVTITVTTRTAKVAVFGPGRPDDEPMSDGITSA